MTDPISPLTVASRALHAAREAAGADRAQLLGEARGALADARRVVDRLDAKLAELELGLDVDAPDPFVAIEALLAAGDTAGARRLLEDTRRDFAQLRARVAAMPEAQRAPYEADLGPVSRAIWRAEARISGAERRSR